ncbi:hypothetical protein ACIQHY_25770 [Streptomyces sp. NPDC092359]|uniref:hypothetical protein n=1 Tax=Streptomyces sp. NPDC092359 TaxID=3366014 RepID=UPI00380D591A
MGHRQDQSVPCGRQLPDPLPGLPYNTWTCPGQKSTVYEYDDNGKRVSPTMFPCNPCANN